MKMERREVLDKRELNEQVQGLPSCWLMFSL
jgi:hypothetical protein